MFIFETGVYRQEDNGFPVIFNKYGDPAGNNVNANRHSAGQFVEFPKKEIRGSVMLHFSIITYNSPYRRKTTNYKISFPFIVG